MAQNLAVDPDRFADAVGTSFGQLNTSQRSGVALLVQAIAADTNVGDVRWASYMLATVKHECANRWQPIGEFGHGQGRPYGQPVKITDPQGGNHTNIYYGRGYVQLTWEQNYKKVGNAIGLGDDLWIDPDNALDPETAYEIMSYGMRTGIFTGRSLSRFISGTQCDYVEARTIINGHDQAPLIAGYAEQLQAIYAALGVN